MERIEFNIVVASDINYIVAAIETIASVIRFDKDVLYNVYLITDYDSLKKISKFTHILYAVNPNIKLNKIFVEKKDFIDCPIREGDHVSIAAYYRIKLPQLLPEFIDKVLYLDCDILCVKSIKDFYLTDLHGYSCAVCLDERSNEEEIYKRLAYEKKYGYFNSGMMLINLDWWRNNRIQNLTLDYISKNQNALLWHDQDALNYILKGTYLNVPLRYNLLQGYLFLNDYFDEKREVHMIHYCSAYKPWHIECVNPYKKEYREFYRYVFGKKCRLCFKNSGINKLKWLLKFFINKVGFIKYDDFRKPYL